MAMTKYLEQIGTSNRVPMNGTENWKLIASNPGLGHRTARFYNFKAQPSMLPTENVIGGIGASSPNLGDPLVIASLIAGLVGITLSIIIILSIWILKRSKYSEDKKTPTPINPTGISNSNYVGPEPEVVVVVATAAEKPPQIRKYPFRPKETSV